MMSSIKGKKTMLHEYYVKGDIFMSVTFPMLGHSDTSATRVVKFATYPRCIEDVPRRNQDYKVKGEKYLILNQQFMALLLVNVLHLNNLSSLSKSFTQLLIDDSKIFHNI